jgi:hypothetical protein
VSDDWDPHFASIGDEVTPDWEAAARYIDGFTLEQFAELLDWEVVASHIDAATEEHLPATRDVLRNDLAEFRSAAENGHAHMVRFSTRDVFVYVVDDEDQSDLWACLPRLRWSGVLVAAGFDDTR